MFESISLKSVAVVCEHTAFTIVAFTFGAISNVLCSSSNKSIVLPKIFSISCSRRSFVELRYALASPIRLSLAVAESILIDGTISSKSSLSHVTFSSAVSRSPSSLCCDLINPGNDLRVSSSSILVSSYYFPCVISSNCRDLVVAVVTLSVSLILLSGPPVLALTYLIASDP